MKISFFIVNYKSEGFLKSSLKSIFDKVDLVDFEIIIINNDEKRLFLNDFGTKNFCLETITPEDCEKKRDFISKKIILVENNKNVGFGKANNLGVLVSQGDILCFLNPDTEIRGENIGELLEKFEKDEGIGVIGPRILERDKSGKFSVQAWSAGKDFGLAEILKGKIGLSNSEKIWNSQKVIEADWITGACLFIRKRIFLQLGGFDEKFFLYYEDLDLCKRVREAGGKIIFCPKFEIIHLGGKSFAENSKQKELYFASQEYYFKKWFRGGERLLLKMLVFFYRRKYKFFR
ncbi:MAG: glycosyltransferase family 2 protein [Candidatus Moraniibacteriota bacterium]